MEFPFEPHYWNWLILGVGLFIAEVLVSGFFLIWLGLSAFIVCAVCFFIPDLSTELQIFLFALFSILSVSIWLYYRKKNPPEDEDHGLNQRGSEHIDRVFTLSAPIVNGRGKEMLDGIPWGLSGGDLDAGKKVKVVKLDGNHLVVEPVND